MATASGDTWTRNPLADENPDLTRKRQRISEDTETQTSPLSGSGSPVVASLPPEESGTGFHNAIELHDDDADMTSDSYTKGFKLQSAVSLTPAEQLQHVLSQLLNSHHIAPDHFVELSLWLRQHLETTKGESLAKRQHEYTREAEFFGKLAELSVSILNHGGQVFRDIPDDKFDRLGSSVIFFVNDMATLGIRIVPILPLTIDHVIGRRDSGQAKSSRTVQLLQYTQVLAQILALHDVKLVHFKDTFHLKPEGTALSHRQKLLQNPLGMPALTSTLQKLGDRHSEIDGSWDAINAILQVMNTLCSVEGMDAIDDIGRAMATIHHCLLPAVCVMSPRAIPIDVHEVLIKTACRLLSFLLQHASPDESAALYKLYIESDSDALLTGIAERSVTKSLNALSNGKSDNLIGLLRTAWNLQALKIYIFSGIMDVRSSGILQLSTLLLQLYNTHQTSEEGFEHPILQYVGRFMRTNELTKYIFGPDSHASLISHSQNIIGFLAATFLYTDNESDLIWAACTTSVEAEFVKASFGVLTELCRYLDLDHLLYLVKKYAITPPDRLGKDAVETLTDLFQKVKLKSASATDQDRRLTTAFISIEILFKARTAESTSALAQLCETARTELVRFTTSQYSADDRVQIYERCVPNLLEPNERATTSIEIILLFLDSSTVCHKEPQDLLGMLSVGALVDELSHYVDTCRDDGVGAEEAQISGIRTRMNAIVRLQALSGSPRSDSTWATFFEYTTGRLASNNATRDCAWTMLSIMETYADSVGDVARDLLQYSLEAAIDLPLEFLTPTLLSTFGSTLRRRSEGEEFQRDYCLVLQTPAWQKLVETAESTCLAEASDQARKIVCDVLFEYPLAYADKSRVATCHGNFARGQISRICNDFRSFTGSQSRIESQDIIQKIDLLAEVFRRSQLSGTAFEAEVLSQVVLATEPATDVFHCKMLVYGGGRIQPKLHRLQVKATTRLSELASELPKISGADTNRVIIGGQALDLEAQGDRQMSQLGVGPQAKASGVIAICPKHTFQSDIGKLLTPAGEVEMELLAQYDDLEKLLDGPEEIAQKMFSFITGIRPPARQRDRVVTGELTLQELFPPARTWRGAYTIHVLQTHLEDYISLGVLDQSFRLHGIDLLVGIIIDETRSIEQNMFGRAISCLLSFLREQPPLLTVDVIIKRPEEFVSRMVDTCYFFLSYHSELSDTRRSILGSSFRALTEACRHQASLWQAFADNTRVVELHQQVFMHSDEPLVIDICNTIKNFCNDPGSLEGVADFYTNTGLAILPSVLKSKAPCQQFFGLINTILLGNRILRKDESRCRALCQTLVSHLHAYKHSECVETPLIDLTMVGLLSLLKGAIAMLRDFGKPLDVGDLALHLFDTILFPPLKAISPRPLVDRRSRSIAYWLVKATCESPAVYSSLLAAASLPMHDTKNSPAATFHGASMWQRPAWQCSGLSNLGMTCYMNSLLQQLFANVHFRKFIFDTPITDRTKQQLLYQVQYLFARMQNDYTPVIDTSELAKVLGIQTDSQEDVHGFYEDFLSRLDTSMPDESSRRALGRFFSGTLISQIKGECGHVSPKTEPFVDLQMIVKNKANLLDSLQEFVQGEPMEGTNRYKCLVCDPSNGEGRLVNAMRRSCPDSMPDNLTFCLKRFSFESMYGFESKVNDRFEFPQTIDMSRWHRAHLDDPNTTFDEDIFELVGVIVHQGSLQLGHYWSYTLLRNTGISNSRTWVKLEDRMVSTCQGGIEEVQRECFGGLRNNGQERADNAYVLFYQRKACLEEPVSLPGPVLDPQCSSLLPPKVDIPAELQGIIQTNNAWRRRIAHIFDDDFHDYVMWLLAKYDHFSHPSSPRSICDSPQSRGQQRQSSADDFTKRLGEVATTYLQRVATCDSAAAFRLERCIAALRPLMDAQPHFASCILGQIAHDNPWFCGIVVHTNFEIRERILNLTLLCLKYVRQHEETLYKDIFIRIKNAHARVKDNTAPLRFDWYHYLSFAVTLAAPGSWETLAVLDGGYLSWAWDILYTLVTPEKQRKFPDLLAAMQNDPLRVTELFEFTRSILKSANAIIPDDDQHRIPGQGHQKTPDGVLLEPMEVRLLTQGEGEPMWMSCAKFADFTCGWRDFAPGKLMAELMAPRQPQVLRTVITGFIERHVRQEDTVLDSVMHLLLHFCANSADGDATQAFYALSTAIHQWNRAELGFLHVVREAHKLVPLSVVSNTEHWAANYLTSKVGAVRLGTEKWLREAIFEPDPISDYPDLDASRVRQVRKLVKFCCPLVRTAYGSEQPRLKYASVMTTLLGAEEYLKKVQVAGKVRMQSSDEATRASVSRPLSFELAELHSELGELKAIRKIEQEWEVGEPLPVSRRSVELDSEEETTESEVYEDYEDCSVSPR